MDFIFKRSATVEGTPIHFNMPVKGIRFLVKNLTEGDIYVALKKTENKEECLLLPANTAQVVLANEHLYVFGTDVVTVIPDSTSEKGVEIQCLMW